MMADDDVQLGEGTSTFSGSHTDLVDLLEAMTVAGWVTSVPRESRAVDGVAVDAVSGTGSSEEFR